MDRRQDPHASRTARTLQNIDGEDPAHQLGPRVASRAG
jgi:hypothetical protein